MHTLVKITAEIKKDIYLLFKANFKEKMQNNKHKQT